jgi:hypothetical protein
MIVKDDDTRWGHGPMDGEVVMDASSQWKISITIDAVVGCNSLWRTNPLSWTQGRRTGVRYLTEHNLDFKLRFH